MWKAEDFDIPSLGACHVPAREIKGIRNLAYGDFWVADDERIPYKLTYTKGTSPDYSRGFERAGAREFLFFQPEKVNAGIVTCGGICPGLNDVIRALFMELHYIYGVRNILGFRYGLRGLDRGSGYQPVRLTHEIVGDIHTKGGTILGTARGGVDPKLMVDYLKDLGIHMLFVVGGDGTQRAAHAIWEAAREVGYKIAVIGVPKTIDNDINFVYKTFGFDTAVSFAKQAMDAAHNEAKGHPNGIGLVKVMGRDSGFIAAYATLASINVNYCLVPEVPFRLEGKSGLLAHLEARLKRKNHAVIVVAEGAGQYLFEQEAKTKDAGGNVKHGDIGVYLKERINEHFNQKGIEINLKYIDPSYMLRSQPSNANDSIFAADLARYAVHAAMAGKTDMMIGRKYNQFIHVPIPMAVATRKKLNPNTTPWQSVLQATGQPSQLGDFG